MLAAATKKILVIDDDSQIREVIQEYLVDHGLTVVQAENGTSGIEKAINENPDLILLDIDLPDINGREVCKKLKENSTVMHTPIIMLTALNSESAEISGLNSGADDYVSKPFKPALLFARIQSAMDRTKKGLDANALTHLPGNKAIFTEIKSRIDANKEFSVLYFDLNNFKAFNDRYGFLRGDQAIQLTAEILVQCLNQEKDGSSFMGHVGGDDFVAILSGYNCEPVCDQIIKRFDQDILNLYDEDDRHLGKIEAKDRKGAKVNFPIMGLAISVVTNQHKKFTHPGEISFIAGDLKKWVKAEKKSAYLIDRRT